MPAKKPPAPTNASPARPAPVASTSRAVVGSTTGTTGGPKAKVTYGKRGKGLAASMGPKKSLSPNILKGLPLDSDSEASDSQAARAAAVAQDNNKATSKPKGRGTIKLDTPPPLGEPQPRSPFAMARRDPLALHSALPSTRSPIITSRKSAGKSALKPRSSKPSHGTTMDLLKSPSQKALKQVTQSRNAAASGENSNTSDRRTSALMPKSPNARARSASVDPATGKRKSITSMAQLMAGSQSPAAATSKQMGGRSFMVFDDSLAGSSVTAAASKGAKPRSVEAKLSSQQLGASKTKKKKSTTTEANKGLAAAAAAATHKGDVSHLSHFDSSRLAINLDEAGEPIVATPKEDGVSTSMLLYDESFTELPHDGAGEATLQPESTIKLTGRDEDTIVELNRAAAPPAATSKVETHEHEHDVSESMDLVDGDSKVVSPWAQKVAEYAPHATASTRTSNANAAAEEGIEGGIDADSAKNPSNGEEPAGGSPDGLGAELRELSIASEPSVRLVPRISTQSSKQTTAKLSAFRKPSRSFEVVVEIPATNRKRQRPVLAPVNNKKQQKKKSRGSDGDQTLSLAPPYRRSHAAPATDGGETDYDAAPDTPRPVKTAAKSKARRVDYFVVPVQMEILEEAPECVPDANGGTSDEMAIGKAADSEGDWVYG